MESFDSGLQSNNLQPVDLVSVQVRCPECLKRYSIRTGEIKDKRPKFQCTRCRQKFWIAYPECLGTTELVGFPVDWLDGRHPDAQSQSEVGSVNSGELVPNSTVAEPSRDHQCPKCGSKYRTGDTECASCGVIFKKYFDQVKEPKDVRASREVKQLWEAVIEDYDNPEAHDNFVGRCQQESNLDYALKKYRSILEAHSGDAMAQQMVERIVAVATVQWTSKKPAFFPKSKKRRIRMSSIVIFLAMLIMVTGFLIPILRNLVGVGAAILFLTIAMKYYFFRETL